MRILTKIKEEETPNGKRSIRHTVYGTIRGYVSGRFWKTLGNSHSSWDEEQAELWLNGEID